MTWYKKADVASESYNNKVNVSLNGTAMMDIDCYDMVPVQFNIYIDAREWGIKGMTLAVFGSTEVPYVLRDELDNETTGTILVELSKLEKVVEEHKGVVTVGKMRIYVDESLEVNYSSSYIEMWTY